MLGSHKFSWSVNSSSCVVYSYYTSINWFQRILFVGMCNNSHSHQNCCCYSEGGCIQTKTCNNHLFHVRIETKGSCEKFEQKVDCQLPRYARAAWSMSSIGAIGLVQIFKAVHHTPTMTLFCSWNFWSDANPRKITFVRRFMYVVGLIMGGGVVLVSWLFILCHPLSVLWVFLPHSLHRTLHYTTLLDGF